MRPLSWKSGVAQGILHRDTSVERSDSTKLNSVFEGNLSASGKDIPSGMHDEMNSRNV